MAFVVKLFKSELLGKALYLNLVDEYLVLLPTESLPIIFKNSCRSDAVDLYLVFNFCSIEKYYYLADFTPVAEFG
jgi:hypothetical protein